jgi:hypothetical protein
MVFPSKKLPEQTLAGYVADNLPLIEGYLASSVGAPAVVRLIFEATGFELSVPVFRNTLFRARKKSLAKQTAQAITTVVPLANSAPQLRTVIVPSSTNPKTLREIMNEPLDLTQYPRKFTRKDT